jgi:hypothetical protein
MSENKYIAEMHAERRLWQSQLLLAKDQLKSFKNRLSEVNIANTSKEIKAEIEKFQNQFISEREVIDILMHDIRDDEFNLAKKVQENNVATEHRKLEENTVLQERMKIFNKIFSDLGSKFTRFIAKTL